MAVQLRSSPQGGDAFLSNSYHYQNLYLTVRENVLEKKSKFSQREQLFVPGNFMNMSAGYLDLGVCSFHWRIVAQAAQGITMIALKIR